MPHTGDIITGSLGSIWGVLFDENNLISCFWKSYFFKYVSEWFSQFLKFPADFNMLLLVIF